MTVYKVAIYDSRNEIPADDEEHIHAQEAVWQESVMKGYNRQDRHCP